MFRLVESLLFFNRLNHTQIYRTCLFHVFARISPVLPLKYILILLTFTTSRIISRSQLKSHRWQLTLTALRLTRSLWITKIRLFCLLSWLTPSSPFKIHLFHLFLNFMRDRLILRIILQFRVHFRSAFESRRALWNRRYDSAPSLKRISGRKFASFE